jgi:hypothetical protein
MFATLLIVVLGIAALCSAQGSHYLYGPMWGYINRSKGAAKSFIVAAETTLHPNKAPAMAAPRLAIWPGMDTAKGLIQPIIVNAGEARYQGS